MFSTNSAGTSWYPCVKKKNPNIDLTPFMKIKIDHRLKHKIIKLIEYNIGENLDGLGYDNDFLDTTQKAKFMKKRIDNMVFTEIKIFWNAKVLSKAWEDKWQCENISKRYLIKDCSA